MRPQAPEELARAVRRAETRDRVGELVVESLAELPGAPLDAAVIFVARPHVFLGDHAGVAVEGSYQAQQRGVLNIATNQPVHAKVWRFGLMPYLSPSGPGVFKRPVLRLIMAFTQRNDDARALYAYDDVFARRKVEQFYGIGAEWWFNSSSYGQ